MSAFVSPPRRADADAAARTPRAAGTVVAEVVDVRAVDDDGDAAPRASAAHSVNRLSLQK
jgi:hypothetical protein